MDLDALQRRTGDARVVLVLLLALARHAPASNLPRVAQARTFELDVAVATALDPLAPRAAGGFEGAPADLGTALAALERASHGSLDASSELITPPPLTGTLALYRSLVAAVARLSPAPLAPATAS
jgi:hypothetical protein